MLDSRAVEVGEERSSRKEPFSDREVRDLLSKVGKVIVAKGKSLKVIPSAKPADLKGPTGNYRAPMIRKGKTLLVGFNAEALDELL